jgi:3'-phosphoadenosine 5'-phosphosulfate sulfotransferase (PAPS reductase)/FAD synthetase
MREVDDLIDSAMSVLDRAYISGAYTMAPLFSGGHDSLCAVHLASQHRAFRGVVHHIDTGIGAKYTREFVERVCSKYGWTLKVWREDRETYEQIVRDHGFPGPAGHQYVYNRLKDRCIYRITKGKGWKMLVNGSRQQESTRRMGHAAPVRIGEVSKRDGKVRNRKRVWTSPCYDWSKAEQQLYMDEFGLPVNKVKVAVGLSGECFCGAFAAPGERELIREHCPDVSAEIERLTEIAASCGKPCVWGQRPAGQTAIAETGPLCSSCDRRAAASGLLVIET